MVQMSGGDLSMSFDQERAYFKASCLEHDVPEMLGVLSDCALEDRSPIAINVAKQISKKMHQQNEAKMKVDPLEDPMPTVLNLAYGHQTLGMPLIGFESNLENLNAGTVVDFFQEHAVPSRIIFCASGVRNHSEFVQLVENATSRIPPPANTPKPRVKSRYKGGESRVFYDTPSASLSLCFESVPWAHPDMPLFGVLNGLLGSAKGFSMGGPGKGMYSRATQDIFHRYPFIEAVNTINTNFSDSGLFGLTVRGARANAKELSEVVANALVDLKRGVTDEELQRAKNIFKINISMAMEARDNRLEETVKNVFVRCKCSTKYSESSTKTSTWKWWMRCRRREFTAHCAVCRRRKEL
eukprot:TRINITY_DN7808_c0_g1_i3.p1 TRINITY_DN7808_c0_g1~~TRINITY_DN7808_c0_g1_i3.p1  ORF type:complete len:354 (+),score=90.76 TRINITY_DN7808_c0_g1_i3:576-1637(+)